MWGNKAKPPDKRQIKHALTCKLSRCGAPSSPPSPSAAAGLRWQTPRGRKPRSQRCTPTHRPFSVGRCRDTYIAEWFGCAWGWGGLRWRGCTDTFIVLSRWWNILVVVVVVRTSFALRTWFARMHTPLLSSRWSKSVVAVVVVGARTSSGRMCHALQRVCGDLRIYYLLDFRLRHIQGFQRQT